MKYNRSVELHNTTIGKLIDELSKLPKDFKVLIPVYPPGDDYSKHCTIEVWNNEVEIEGIYVNKETWDKE